MAIAFVFLLAMNCQVAAVAADGTEVPYSGAPAVREYGAVLSTNFLGIVAKFWFVDFMKDGVAWSRYC
jgi:hypothetical protein